ncbi:MAG: c-type cytochrome [Blastocatellia bacterium]
MNKGTKFKGLILLTAFIVSSYALATETPAGGTATPPADGNAVYAAKCAICHAKDGRGLPNWRSKGQPDFTDAKWQKSRTDAQITEATKNGKGKFMPAFKAKLSEEEIAAVVARTRAFAKK